MKQGDLIWWNEGGCVGHVQKIIETPEEWAEWGWQGPAAYFGNLHPYDPNIIGVGYPAECFEDEGIAKLSESEHSALAAALDVALSSAPTAAKGCPFSVSTRCENNRMVEWIFQFWIPDSNPAVIAVPPDDSQPPPWTSPSALRKSLP